MEPIPTKQLISQELAPRSTLVSFWNAALANSDATVWPYLANETEHPGIFSLVGTVLDKRLRTLFQRDPLPHNKSDLPNWEEERWTLKDQYYGTPPKTFEEDLEHLTDLAVKVLIPMFNGVPLDSRHTQVDTLDLVELGCVEGLMALAMPDLILGDTLVEIKCCKQPEKILKPTMVQIAKMILLDRFDHYGLRNIAVYLARQGIVVTLPVHALFDNMSSAEDLVGLREAYRIARDRETETWMINRLAPEGNVVQKRIYSIIWFFREVVGQILRDQYVLVSEGERVLQGFVEELSRARGSRPPHHFPGRFAPASYEIEWVSQLIAVHQFEEIMDALRSWRLALKREMEWPGSAATSLQTVLHPQNVQTLAQLAKTGEFPT